MKTLTTCDVESTSHNSALCLVKKGCEVVVVGSMDRSSDHALRRLNEFRAPVGEGRLARPYLPDQGEVMRV